MRLQLIDWIIVLTFLSGSLAVGLAVTMAACGGDDGGSDSSATSAAAASESRFDRKMPAAEAGRKSSYTTGSAGSPPRE